MKKLLTLEDLVIFCRQNQMFSFSAHDAGYQLAVHIPSTFEVNDGGDDSLMYCTVKMFHVGENLNHSAVTFDAAQKSLSTIAYKPLLANFCEVNGVKDFTSHDMIVGDDGKVQYLERQIGCFTADNPEIKLDAETNKQFVFARVAIPREYTDACEIIERKGGTKVSVELLVNDMQYSAKDDLLVLTDVAVSGCTCLGVNPETGEDVDEGMQGAKLTIDSFSTNNNSIEPSTEDLAEFNNKFFEKGADSMNKLQELLEKYGKTVEELDFDYEHMTDEELVEAFAKFDETADESTDLEPEQETDEQENTSEPEQEQETDEEPAEEAASEDIELTFKLSHEDTRYNLQKLLSSVNDGDNLYVEQIFDKYFVYTDWSGMNAFKQEYKVRKNNVSFDGDPVPVFREYVTQEERDQLDSMRQNYSALVEFKETTEANRVKAEKEAIFASEDYAVIVNDEDFINLVNNAEQYSVDECKDRADIIFAKHVRKAGTFSVVSADNKKMPKINMQIETQTEERKPYGTLFD